MPQTSVTELDLLGFFGGEPTSSGEDIPWYYRESEYAVDCAGTSVTLTIHPACCDVQIILKRNSVTFYELKAEQIEDVRHHHDSGRETIEIVFSESNRLWLRLYPCVRISQHATPEL